MISLAKPYSQIQALLLFVVLFFLSACHHRHQEAVDKLNDLAYDYHYRNLDTVSYYAAKAMAQSGTYDGGKAGGWCNCVPVYIIDEEVAAKHTVEIKMADGEESKGFTIVAMGYSR